MGTELKPKAVSANYAPSNRDTQTPLTENSRIFPLQATLPPYNVYVPHHFLFF